MFWNNLTFLHLARQRPTIDFKNSWLYKTQGCTELFQSLCNHYLYTQYISGLKQSNTHQLIFLFYYFTVGWMTSSKL